MRRQGVLAAAFLMFVGLASAIEPGGQEAATLVVVQDSPYYLNSPAQARPPDGTFKAGTRVSVLTSAGSYILVRTETGIRAYVVADALKEIEDKGISAVVDGNNQFAADLYAHLRGTAGNLFFSPYSISTALAMTHAGAAGETEKQMTQVLHFTLAQEQLDAAMQRLGKAITGETKKGYELRIANRLWGQQGYPFLPGFLETARRYYGAELGSLDFARDTEKARTTINAWVEQQTAEKIQDLIPPGVLGPLTRLVLTNAIYFKGNWQEKFSKDATQDAPFHISANQQVAVPMMHQTERFGYRAVDDLQILEMPYADKALSMIVLLPKKIDGLSRLEETLTPENLRQWSRGLQPQKVNVYMPRFKMNSEFSLKDTLREMGMTLAFDDRKADFSRMTSSEGLCISAVVHKAFVDVNEEGTEAAAATGVVMMPSAAPVQQEPPTFRADHPFVFLIRDNQTGSILFMGRVTSPRQ